MKDINKDPLTGLYTAVSFDMAIDSAMVGDESGRSTSIALFDIDRFLEVNRAFGHDEGDAVLKELASLFLNSFAETDIATYRIGGDEFAVLMPGIEKEKAFLNMESARSDFADLDALGYIEPHPTLSAGVATYPDDGSTRQEVIRKANDALFRAKSAGRNRVALAREEKKIPKTSHYTHGQLERLGTLSKKEGVGEAELLREALDDLLKKYNS